MAEFREQDSYVNSDYDSDSEYEAGPDGVPTPRTGSPTPLTNSLITQARTLVEATAIFRRPDGLPRPRVGFVLNRMSAEDTYADPRIEETFRVIRDMGVDLVLGDQPRPASSLNLGREKERVWREPIPTRNVLLDLSVLVALCCDSTHHPLPVDEDELESRFRAIQPSTELSSSQPTPTGPASRPELAPHNNVTRDLRDQLKWEMQHSLIGELHSQLSATLDQGKKGGRVQFWVTEEVKGRLPNIVDVIGGPCERARADALFGRLGPDGEVGDFWRDSRWKGKAPALGDMRLNILPTPFASKPKTPTEGEDDTSSSRAESSQGRGESGSESEPLPIPDLSSLDISALGNRDRATYQNGTQAGNSMPPFHLRMSKVCQSLLSPRSTPVTAHTPLHKQKYRFSRNPNRPATIFPTPTKAPSGHTLNSFIAGAQRGWTVLTNNRGAVNRVCRDMGVLDGLPYENESSASDAVGEGEDDGEGDGEGEGEGEGEAGRQKAVVWIVNPSSLSEWRRLEVVESNRRLLEGINDEPATSSEISRNHNWAAYHGRSDE